MYSGSAALDSVAVLMDTGKYSDLKLVCQEQEFKVHKAVVCTQSPVLAAACDGGFQEAEANSIHINEFDAETVKRRVEFLYAKDYSNGVEEQRSEAFNQPNNQAAELDLLALKEVEPLCTMTPAITTKILLRNVRVNAIGDYYDLPELKQAANKKIQHILASSWSAEDFPEIVQEAFKSTSDKHLHDLMTFTAATHIEELLELKEFTSSELMSDFSVSAICDIIAVYKVKEQISAHKLRTLETRLQHTESQLQSAKQDCVNEKSQRDTETTRADRVIENIDDCVGVLARSRVCRNISCDADFTCFIERDGFSNEPRYMLRCAKCKCRHRSFD